MCHNLLKIDEVEINVTVYERAIQAKIMSDSAGIFVRHPMLTTKDKGIHLGAKLCLP